MFNFKQHTIEKFSVKISIRKTVDGRDKQISIFLFSLLQRFASVTHTCATLYLAQFYTRLSPAGC